jgi:hypothetical protein
LQILTLNFQEELSAFTLFILAPVFVLHHFRMMISELCCRCICRIQERLVSLPLK